MDRVRSARMEWSLRVDDALIRKVDTTRRCSECGRKLPFSHRYSICDDCYMGGHWFHYGDDYEDDEDYREISYDSPDAPLSLNPSPTQAERGTSNQMAPLSPRLRGGKGLGDRGAIDQLRKVSYESVQQKPLLPTPGVKSSDICPVCEVNLVETPQARLAHWQETHADWAELTISYAAWMVGCPRNDLPQKIAFDRRGKNGDKVTRWWNLTTLARAINDATDSVQVQTA